MGAAKCARLGTTAPCAAFTHGRRFGALCHLSGFQISREDTNYLGRCTIGWVVLDGKDPTRIISRSETALIVPELPWEKTTCMGGKNNTCQTPYVIFSTGMKPLGNDDFLVLYVPRASGPAACTRPAPLATFAAYSMCHHRATGVALLRRRVAAGAARVNVVLTGADVVLTCVAGTARATRTSGASPSTWTCGQARATAWANDRPCH